jgi:hypothetical protein
MKMEGQMVAVKEKIIFEPKEGTVCGDCGGTGIISHWSEVSYFEDRRLCRCEAGRLVDAKIAEIIARAQSEDRPFRLH